MSPWSLVAIISAACLASWVSVQPAGEPDSAPILISRPPGDALFTQCVTPPPGPPPVFKESEAHAAVNPRDARNIVVAWQVGSKQGRAIQASASFDAGRSWSEPRTIPVNSCAGGPYWVLPAAADPWVAFGPEGRVYVAGIGFRPSDVGPDLANAVVVWSSPDGGRTWEGPGIAAVSLTPHVWHDNVAIAADPRAPGVTYMATTRYEYPALKDLNFGEQPHLTPGQRLLRYGPAAIAKTTDGGKSWSPLQAVTPLAEGGRVSAPQIAIDPRSGALLIVYYRTDARSKAISLIRSDDGGRTWTAQMDIADYVAARGREEPIHGESAVLAEDIVRVAIDPRSGAMVVVFVDGRFTGGKRFAPALTMSTDGGKSWSTPVRVDTGGAESGWLAAVAVNEASEVGVVYLTADLATPSDRLVPVAVNLRVYRPEGGQLLAQADREEVLDRFNYAWPGDYLGLVAVGTEFHAVYAKSTFGPSEPAPAGGLTTENPTDVFFH